MKKGKKETRHLADPLKADRNLTICGRPIEKVLLWAKKAPPKADDAMVCGRCRALKAGADKRAARPGVRNKKVVDLAVNPETPKSGKPESQKPGKRQPGLAGISIPGDALFGSYKGETFTATVLGDGRIHLLNGDHPESFNSPSGAAKAIKRKPVDGWLFWKYQRADGTKGKISELRKAAA